MKKYLKYILIVIGVAIIGVLIGILSKPSETKPVKKDKIIVNHKIIEMYNEDIRVDQGAIYIDIITDEILFPAMNLYVENNLDGSYTMVGETLNTKDESCVYNVLFYHLRTQLEEKDENDNYLYEETNYIVLYYYDLNTDNFLYYHCDISFEAFNFYYQLAQNGMSEDIKQLEIENPKLYEEILPNQGYDKINKKNAILEAKDQ